MNYHPSPIRWIVLVLVALLISGCTTDTSITRDKQTVEDQQSIYQRNQPVPLFDWSQDRDVLIQIYQAKNEARTTYTVVTADGSGQVLFVCPSIGYALPADTQLTNGLQALNWTGAPVVEQAEPNGLYSSKNTDGTYVLCVRDNGEIAPVYTEAKVTTYPFEVKVVDGQIVDAGGTSSITLNLTRRPAAAPADPQPTVQP